MFIDDPRVAETTIPMCYVKHLSVGVTLIVVMAHAVPHLNRPAASDMWSLKEQFLDLERLTEQVGVSRVNGYLNGSQRSPASQFTITRSAVMRSVIAVSLLYLQSCLLTAASGVETLAGFEREECKLRPIIHHLKYPGCVPKSISQLRLPGDSVPPTSR